MEDILIHKIRLVIENKVYISRKQERIIPEHFSWIMDFRSAFMKAEILDAYAELFWERFEKEWPFQVGGAEVAAIPLVTAIALKMSERGKPVNAFFIRKSRKKTGLLKIVEGKMTDEPVIFVDDLINRGITFDRQILVAEEAKARVLALFVALRFRPIDYYTVLNEKNIRIESLFTLDDFRETLGTEMKQMEDEKPVPKIFNTQWRYQAQDPKLEWVQPKSGIVLDEEKIYFGTDQGEFLALNKVDGSKIWSHKIGLRTKGAEIFSTPIIVGESVFFGAHDGNVYCLDRNTGKRIWVSFEADWVRGSLLALPEYKLVIVPCMFGFWNKQGGVMTLDLKTGKKKWECRVEGTVTGSPVYSRKQNIVFFGTHDGNIYAIDRLKGNIIWSFKTLGSIPEGLALDQRAETLVASSMDGCVYALRPKDGSLKWKYDAGVGNYASPYIWQGKVFITSLDKHVYCLDLATGKEFWKFPTRARIFASPRIYDGKLYVGGNDARLYELDPETGKETSYFQVIERITNPFYQDPQTGLFYLVTYANEVYCLAKKVDK